MEIFGSTDLRNALLGHNVLNTFIHRGEMLRGDHFLGGNWKLLIFFPQCTGACCCCVVAQFGEIRI